MGYNQNYIPLVDTNSVWNITWNCYKPPPFPCYSDYYRYRIYGDTVYDSTLYKRLYRIDLDQECSLNIEDSVYVGGIREEIAEKKVYFIEYAIYGERLLYDFTLEIGDTVPNTMMTVSAIDSILCSDGYRKRFVYYRDTYPNIYVVEGIGAFTGLIEQMEIFEHVSTLRCFYSSGTMIFMHPNVNSCTLEMDTCLTTNVIEKNYSPEEIKVYPNPFSNSATIKIANIKGQLSDYRYHIIDVNGRIQQSSVLSGKETVIENRNLTPGIYFCIVNYKDQRLYSEIILIKQ